ncbi:uncharacterized protein METZ01_LOCUS963 [marine metagenome]|uniref:Uncharacterized protein n=1 Tax=marine metagenome TaxID=408172 RepID=A0A381N0U9_9ZZZZ
MKQKDIITSVIAITAGIVLVLLPLFFHIKRSIILIGIVPLWMGFYIILNTYKKKES